MKTIILKNNSNKNVGPYPISEAEFNTLGELVVLDNGTYRETGNTLEWSLPAGETFEFPEYVSNILLSRYGFLEIVKQDEKKTEIEDKPIVVKEQTSKKSVNGEYLCRGCGKGFKAPKAMALHLAARHPELL